LGTIEAGRKGSEPDETAHIAHMVDRFRSRMPGLIVPSASFDRSINSVARLRLPLSQGADGGPCRHAGPVADQRLRGLGGQTARVPVSSPQSAGHRRSADG
jgi:hypothetical protein